VTAPSIHGFRPVLTASAVRQALGDELSLIRQQDGLTWADIGEVLGKSEDQAAKYADGSAEMGVVAYAKAKKQWNGRFTGGLDRLIHDARGELAETDREREGDILAAALALSKALADGEITHSEIRTNRKTLEHARDAIDDLLSRLPVRAA